MLKVSKFVLIALAVVAGVSSCKKTTEPTVGDDVNFTLSTTMPDRLTRLSSDGGGAANVDAAAYDLRYTLGVYSGTTLVETQKSIVKTNFKDGGVSFSVKLPAAEYSFVVWADFVDEGSTADKFYNTADLTAVAALAYTEANEARDAYCGKVDVDLATTATATLELVRPFGKYRIVYTGPAIDPKTTSVAFSADVPSTYNMLTGASSGAMTPAYTTAVSTEDVVSNGKQYTSAKILAFDYVFPSKVEFTLSSTAFDDTAFSFDAKTNCLTTVLINSFSKTGTANVSIDDEFAGKEDVQIVTGNPFEGTNKIEGTVVATLTDDVTLKGPITVKDGASLEIKTDGNDINTGDYQNSITVESGGELKITGTGNETINGNLPIIVQGGGKVILEDITIQSKKGNFGQWFGVMISGENNVVEIKKCTLQSVAGSSYRMIFFVGDKDVTDYPAHDVDLTVVTAKNSSVTITNSTFQLTENSMAYSLTSSDLATAFNAASITQDPYPAKNKYGYVTDQGVPAWTINRLSVFNDKGGFVNLANATYGNTVTLDGTQVVGNIE